MKFSPCQVLLIAASISAFEIDKIADGVDNIFLRGNITAEESRSILEDARESYQTLSDYNNEEDPERKKILLTRVRTFTSMVVDDLHRADMTLRQLFRNINSYLKENGSTPLKAEEPLTTAIPIILGLLERKIAQYNSESFHSRYDVKRILSVKDGSADNIFRDNDSITPTAIGYFFLEAFATIFGLSWGIISMIITRPQ